MRTPPSSHEAERLARLAHDLEAEAHTHGLSGAMLLTRGGEVLLEAYVGLADRATGTPVTAATRFGTASVTKMFTACTVVDLVADGRLSFATPVVEVLPSGRRPRTLSPEVTVHHLLCHTSGIADYCEEEEDSPAYVEDYGALWADRPSYSMTRPVDFLPLFGDLPPYRSPGGRFQYSNAGYVLLGLVVEELSGRPFAEVVQERVLSRAGMGSSGFLRLDDPLPDVATGYLPSGRTNIYSVPVVGGGDGGALCTARDLDRFLRAYADGTLLGPLADTVLTRHTEAGDGFGEGYGVHLYPDGRYGHGGGDPGVEALVHRWPDDDVHLVVLCNTEDGFAGPVRDRMIAAWRG
jgi:CubicO group peptidase (beta-lactamase class C family)